MVFKLRINKGFGVSKLLDQLSLCSSISWDYYKERYRIGNMWLLSLLFETPLPRSLCECHIVASSDYISQNLMLLFCIPKNMFWPTTSPSLSVNSPWCYDFPQAFRCSRPPPIVHRQAVSSSNKAAYYLQDCIIMFTKIRKIVRHT